MRECNLIIMLTKILHLFCAWFFIPFCYTCPVFLWMVAKKRRSLIGSKISTPNQMPPFEWFLELPLRAKPSTLDQEKNAHNRCQIRSKYLSKAKVTYENQRSDLLVYPSRQYFEPGLAGFAG